MPTAWFLCPMSHIIGPHGLNNGRECAMNQFTASIFADGGNWREIEVLGDQAIVKVQASAGTLTAIAGTATFRRIPLGLLDDSLGTLTAGQRNAIKNELTDAGYTLAEVNARFPNLASATLRDVLRFFATRRRKPRYDPVGQEVVLDGPDQVCGDVDVLDGTIV